MAKKAKAPKKSATKKASAKPSSEQPSNPSPAPPSEPAGRRREFAKKTGKRGPRPLNPQTDFDNPTTVAPTPGEPLFPVAEQRSPAIQHGKMAAHFVKYVPDRTKNRDRIVFLDFSLELEDAHAGRLPREIEDAWKDLKNGSIKRIDPNGIGSQNLAISLVPDGQVDLQIVAAVPKASISRITAKGKGKERKITRLQMRFLTSFTKDVEEFCANAYDETTWLTIEESQRSFGDEEEAAD
jgi:hypothetical protein